MGRRTGIAFAPSQPAGTGSSPRILSFISGVVWVFLIIFQTTFFIPLGLVSHFGDQAFTRRDLATNTSRPINPPNRNPVVQGRDLPLAALHNNNEPTPPAQIRHRHMRTPLLSLKGTLIE
ncbi:hypothetical protein RSAG8_08343, partial [Rhizoctonia solani AG-8 WAC10335]